MSNSISSFQRRKEEALQNIDTDQLKRESWDYFINLSTRYNSLFIFRSIKGGRLVCNFEEAKNLTATRIINFGELQDQGLIPDWYNKERGIVKANGIFWNLDNLKEFALIDLILFPNTETHWFSQHGAILYEELTNEHLANIVYKQCFLNHRLDTKIKEEVLRRFRLELVGKKFVKTQCCHEGVREFVSSRSLNGKPLDERTVVNIEELLILLENETEIRYIVWLGIIIKEAIKFYDNFYRNRS